MAPKSHSQSGTFAERAQSSLREGGKVLSGFAGSCPERAKLAAGAALEAGVTRLGALIVGHVASRGRHCWETDESIAGKIVQANGRTPHPRSVARSRRAITALGLLQATRRYPGQRIVREARFKTSHGCLVKSVKFGRLGVRDPLRAEKREHAQPKPRHSSAAAIAVVHDPPVSTAAMDPTLARAVDELGSVLERRWAADEQAQDAAMLDSLPRRPPKPPD